MSNQEALLSFLDFNELKKIAEDIEYRYKDRGVLMSVVGGSPFQRPGAIYPGSPPSHLRLTIRDGTIIEPSREDLLEHLEIVLNKKENPDCKHKVLYDIDGYPYMLRICATCGFNTEVI